MPLVSSGSRRFKDKSVTGGRVESGMLVLTPLSSTHYLVAYHREDPRKLLRESRMPCDPTGASSEVKTRNEARGGDSF